MCLNLETNEMSENWNNSITMRTAVISMYVKWSVKLVTTTYEEILI